MTTTSTRKATDYSTTYAADPKVQYETTWDNSNFQAAYLQELEKLDPKMSEFLDRDNSLLDFKDDERKQACEALVTSFNKMDFADDRDRKDCAWNVADAFYKDSMKEIEIDEAVKFFNLDPALADKLRSEGITNLSYQAQIHMPDGTIVDNDNPTDFLYQTKTKESAQRLLDYSPSFTTADHILHAKTEFANTLYESSSDQERAKESLFHQWEKAVGPGGPNLPEAEKIEYSWLSDANRTDHETESGLRKVLDFYTSEAQELAEKYGLATTDQIMEDYLSYARSDTEKRMKALLVDTSLTSSEKDEEYEELVRDLCEYNVRVKDFLEHDEPLVDNSKYHDKPDFQFVTTDIIQFPTAEAAHEKAAEIAGSMLASWEKIEADSDLRNNTYRPAMMMAQELMDTLKDAYQQFGGSFGQDAAAAGYPQREVQKALEALQRLGAGLFNADGSNRKASDPYG